MSTSTSKVPFGQKLAFGLGMLANQMFPAVLGIFIVVLVDNLGFPGWMLGLLYFLPRVFDSITDPIMGFISDNTKSKWGRRKHYVVIGAIIMGVSFALMWQLYNDNTVNYNFIYFLIWSLVFYLGLTIFSVPYVAMGYEMSDDFHERTNIMATAQLIGQLAWVIAPWFWVIMFDTKYFESGEVATRTLAVYVAIGCGLLAAVPGIFIKGESTLEKNYASLTLDNIKGSFDEIILGFKEALKIVPFKKLCLATFLIFNAFNTIAGFSFFIIKYYLFAGNEGGMGYWPTLFGSVGAIVTTVLVIPIVAQMSKRMGKKKAFLWSQGISILGYLSFWFLFIPGKPWMFLYALPFHSFGIGSLFTLMMSMTSDVIDIDELNTGKRREGIFGAIYWWMVKFGLAIAGLLSGIILSIVGFESGAPTQSAESMNGLRFFFSGLPILGTLAAMYIMRDYSVTEEKANEVSRQLKLRKNPPKTSIPLKKLEQFLSVDELAKLSDASKWSNKSIQEAKQEFRDLLNSQIHGLCFGAYTEGQHVGDFVSREQIDRRMDILKAYTKWVRSFSCSDGHEYIPVAAKERGLNVMAGAWIGNDKERNKLEIDTLAKLANAGQVDIAVVGNEALMRGDISVDELVSYIEKLKELAPNTKVGYVDAYYIYHEHSVLVDVCDVILINCYPFWEGSPLEMSAAYVKAMYNSVNSISQGKEVIISETGWPSDGESQGQAIASELNAALYFAAIQNWTKSNNIAAFYFSSFDESWKVQYEGNVGDKWGIWDSQEMLKYK